jgi:hypothetical protein
MTVGKSEVEKKETTVGNLIEVGEKPKSRLEGVPAEEV